MAAIIRNNKYPFQLWLTSVAGLAPLLFIAIGIIEKSNNVGLESIPAFVMIGLLFSLPMLALCYVIYMVLIRKLASAILIKVIVNLITIAGIFLTFHLIKGSMALMLSLIYSVSVILASIFYRINKN